MTCQCGPQDAPFICARSGCAMTVREQQFCAGTANLGARRRKKLEKVYAEKNCKADPPTSPVSLAEEHSLHNLPCLARGKREGTVVCGAGGASGAYQCSKFGLVILNRIPLEMRSCEQCIDEKEHKPPKVKKGDRVRKVVLPELKYPAVVASGPGSELKSILAELGQSAHGGCGCDDYAKKMDRWGVAGCRLNRSEIVQHLKSQAKWRDRISGAIGAVKKGLWLNPLHPFESLVDEAIRRAEKHPETNWLSSVSIIITARNYGRFLPEAIESALGQSVKCEVIYSDDFSTDDSVAIARRYPIKVVTADAHGGVCVARNRGVAESTAELLIHLDGDDVLTPTYAADHLAAFVPGTPFVYGSAKTFGDGQRAGIFWSVQPWPKADIWRGNCVNTSAMYARWAFDRSGGWRDGAGTMWDFDLALRAAKLGLPLNSKAVLNYRQHGESVSHQNGEATSEGFRTATAKAIRKLNADVTVGTIWSGRLPEMVEGWISDIAESVKGLPRKPNLVILDHSHDAEKRRMLERAAGIFSWAFDGVVIESFGQPLEWKTEHERRDAVSTLLAGANNRLKELSRELLWIIEDDVFVPADAAGKLFDTLTTNCGPWKIPHAATGWYVSRHARTPHYLTGFIRDGKFNHAMEANPEPVEVDWSGCGCLMLWRDRTPEFTSHAGKTPAHDWAWSQDLKQLGGVLLAVPVGCRHAVGAGEFV